MLNHLPIRRNRNMTLDDFRQSLSASEPPAGLPHALAGLWWDGKGNWTRAHESAQQDEGVEAIRATQRISMVGLASPCAGSRWMQSGLASLERCCDKGRCHAAVLRSLT